MIFMKKKYLYFFTKIDTTEISVFNFDRNLIIVSINYDMYEKRFMIYKNVDITFIPTF